MMSPERGLIGICEGYRRGEHGAIGRGGLLSLVEPFQELLTLDWIRNPRNHGDDCIAGPQVLNGRLWPKAEHLDTHQELSEIRLRIRGDIRKYHLYGGHTCLLSRRGNLPNFL